MSYINLNIRSELGAIPVGAVLTYDGHGHLDMEGTHEHNGFRVHPMTVSILNGLNRDAIEAQSRETRYRVMGHSPHMVYLSYNAHELTEPPTASSTPPAETTTPEAEDNPKDETFHPFTLALEFE